MNETNHNETLFEIEEEIIKKNLEICTDEAHINNPLIKDLSNLTNDYKKLYRQSKKLIKLSDNLQKNLSLANLELEEKNNLLDARNKEIERDLALARQIQQNLIPRKLPKIPGLEIEAFYKPMDLVGGDFYDFLLTKEKGMGVLISDVSGHGLPAAFITSMLKIAFTMLHKDIHTPKEFLTNLNDYLYNKTANNYVTAAYNYFPPNTNTMVYTNAGHPSPLIYRRKEDKMIELNAKGSIIGMLNIKKYEEHKIELLEGDRILFYTDGLIEATNEKDEIFGDRKLQEFIKNNIKIPLKKFVSNLYETVNIFKGEKNFEDDIAVIALDVK